MTSLICGIYKERRKMNLLKNRIRLTLKRMNLWLSVGRTGERDSLGVWDGYVHTATFEMENQQGPTVERREPCSVLCGSLDGRGVWG